MLFDLRRVLDANANAEADATCGTHPQPTHGSRPQHFSHSIALATFSHRITRYGNRQLHLQHPRQQIALTLCHSYHLLLSVHVCVAYNTARQQPHSRMAPILYVWRGSTPIRWLTHAYINVCFVCVCECVFLYGVKDIGKKLKCF